MKVVYYSEKLNKYFNSENECKKAEAALTAESDSQMILQTELDDLLERVDLLIKKIKKHYETYGSVSLKMKLGDKAFPIALSKKDSSKLLFHNPFDDYFTELINLLFY